VAGTSERLRSCFLMWEFRTRQLESVTEPSLATYKAIPSSGGRCSRTCRTKRFGEVWVAFTSPGQRTKANGRAEVNRAVAVVEDRGWPRFNHLQRMRPDRRSKLDERCDTLEWFSSGGYQPLFNTFLGR
jgi:hypothetical protein